MLIGEEIKRIGGGRKNFGVDFQAAFINPLESLAKIDLHSTKELKRRWEKTGSDFFYENSKFMAKRGKDEELSEEAMELADLKRIYHEASLDYVVRIDEVLSQELIKVTEATVALYETMKVFNERERTVLEQLAPHINALNYANRGEDAVTMRQRNMERLDRRDEILTKSRILNLYNPLTASATTNLTSIASKCERDHDGTFVSSAVEEGSGEDTLPSANEGQELTLRGYLYKRSSHLMRAVWSRRFFILHHTALEYYTLDYKNNSPTVRIDLRLCNVRPVEHAERRNCFELVSPVK